MKRVTHADGQLLMLHICCVCNRLVAHDRALTFEPESEGANSPLHPACVESECRWSRRAHAYWDAQDTEAAVR